MERGTAGEVQGWRDRTPPRFIFAAKFPAEITHKKLLARIASGKPTNPQEPQHREEAERFLRERLGARDDGTLPMLLSGRNLMFDEWADWFLEKRSKPPIRSEKTHQQNTNAVKLLRPVFGSLLLSEITPGAIEDYIERRLNEGRRIHTKFGLVRRGKVKPATVHQEFRVLRHRMWL
jgi:hypothetical protein